MRRPTSDQVKQAWTEVERLFPFAGYLSMGKRKEMEAVLDLLFDHIPADWNAPRLLDIGSGPMDKTALFSLMGFNCYSVDDLNDPWHRRDDNVGRIMQFADAMNIHFHLQEDGERTIPVEECSVDLVTIFSVIEHLHESPRGILNTAGAYLKPGGLLCVTMPNSVNLRKRLSVIRGRSNYPPVDQFFSSEGLWRGHVREYTLAETAYVLREAGFEVLASATMEGVAYERLSGLPLKVFLLATSLAPTLRSRLCVIGRKSGDWALRESNEDEFRRALARSVSDGIA